MTDESDKERRLRERLEKLRQEFEQGQSQLIQAEARVRDRVRHDAACVA